MRKTFALLLVFILSVSMVSVLPVKAEAKTVVVPDDYATVSLAIENALDGDTVFVRKGTYQEVTLELNKPLQLLGEEVNETILNLDPPLVETMIFHNRLLIPATALTINADNVKLQGLTINITEKEDYGFGSDLSAFGDGIEIVGNKIGTGSSLQLSGSFLNISDNSLGDMLVVGSNQTIANNLIQEYLRIQGSFNKIIGNSIKSLHNYFYLNGSFNFVLDNSFSTLSMEDSSSNLVIANSFRSLTMIDYGHGHFDNLITKNRVTGNGGVNDGIKVEAGSNNIISANTIRDCESAVSLSGNVTESSVYLNNFVNNSVNIQYHGDADWTLSNRFDNGAKGNYYDDYKGADSNGDGIGDVSYTIKGTRWDSEAGGVVDAGLSQDRYPLMAPVDIDSVNIELPDWVSGLLEPSSEPRTEEPFPIALVVASVALVVVSVGLLLYLKRRR